LVILLSFKDILSDNTNISYNRIIAKLKKAGDISFS